MAHSYTCLLYHLVFFTKDREPWLQGELRPRLWEYLSGAIRGEGGFCLLANGVADRVHLLARLRQDKAVSDVLRSIKPNSSGWIHDRFPKLRSFRCQDGYGAFTSANPRWKRCVVTLPVRKPTTESSRFKKNSWRFSRHMRSSTTSGTFGNECCSP
jgi:putative transposase